MAFVFVVRVLVIVCPQSDRTALHSHLRPMELGCDEAPFHRRMRFLKISFGVEYHEFDILISVDLHRWI